MLLVVASNYEWWLNYPGLEAWKFINLGIFIAVALYLLRRRLKEALLARRERIRLELVEAENERQEAALKLSEAEALLANVDADVAGVRNMARKEAEMERQRLATATEREIEKLGLQAEREIETASKVAKKELQKFLAQRSVDLAREAVRLKMRPDDDVRLINESIEELRRSKA
jgi:F0F1-type ATP synthase membrane subunit b/b'